MTDEGDNHSERGDEQEWWELEIAQLKDSLKALNVQLFQERKAWLAEKQALQAGAGAGGAGADSPYYQRRHTVHEGGPGAYQAMQLQQQLAAAYAQIRGLSEERGRLQESAKLLEAEAALWHVERASLQSQVEVLMGGGGPRHGHGGHSGGGGGAGAGEDGSPLAREHASAAAIATLEEEKWALQMELDLLKSAFKHSLVIPKAHMGQLPAHLAAAASGGGASRQASSTSGLDEQAGNGGGSELALGSGAAAAEASATISRLEAEVARLQAELYILKDECVPVPKPEYTLLKAVHSEKAALEAEARSLRAEVSDLGRLNRLLREEMDMIKEEHMAVTVQEYDELRRAAAEKGALEAKIEAQAKYFAQVPKEELAELQAARRTAAALEAQVASLSAAREAGAGESERALAAAAEEAKGLRLAALEANAAAEEARKQLASAEERAAAAMVVLERVRELEAASAGWTQERARLELRVRALDEEVAALRSQLASSRDEMVRLSQELGTERDTGAEARRELSAAQRARAEAEGRARDGQRERELITQELVEAKLELAKLREMELLYKKTVLHNQRQLFGTPSREGVAAAATAAS